MSLELTSEEIRKVFHETYLEQNYNFLVEDLEKLANAFVAASVNKIARAERAECIKFVNSLNTTVGKALEEKRGHL